jgi:glutamyl-tRNA synthetase
MEWVVRFEDIDRPRVLTGVLETQLADLRTLGLVPDRVLIQSEQHPRHEALFRAGIEAGQLYPCSCSRRQIQEELRGLASAPHGEQPVYTGCCRDPLRRPEPVHPTLAWRFRNPDDPSGQLDFVVGRTDASGAEFVPAYHWACAIDDYDGNHALLVRASDLAHALPVQRLIHAWAGEHERKPRPYPAVFHTALVTDDAGCRLEKRTQGVTLPEILAGEPDVERLLKRFARSFDERYVEAFAPGKVWDEEPAELRLGNILAASR